MTRPPKLAAVQGDEPMTLGRLLREGASRRIARLAGETSEPAPARRLRPVTLEWSWQVYPHEPLACKWRAAVEWLRTQSKTGWHIDKQQERKA